MIGYKFNDGGRAAAGRKGSARDCVARALAILTQRDYTECYKALATANKVYYGSRSARNGIHAKVFDKVFAEFGLRKVKLGRCKPTYSQAHAEHGDCIVTTAKHMCAIVDGDLQDTFDGRAYDGTCYGKSAHEQRKAMSVWIRA